jgi:hypothetical protein
LGGTGALEEVPTVEGVGFVNHALFEGGPLVHHEVSIRIGSGKGFYFLLQPLLKVPQTLGDVKEHQREGLDPHTSKGR